MEVCLGACARARVWLLPVSVPHQIPSLTEYEGACECVSVCVRACVCVQPDAASHTLSVFSISYLQVEQLVTEEVGQAIRLQEVECATHHPAANLIIYFMNYFL